MLSGRRHRHLMGTYFSHIPYVADMEAIDRDWVEHANSNAGLKDAQYT